MEEAVKIPNVFDDEQVYVGEVYAKALVGAAKQANSVDAVVDQLTSLVRDVLNKQPAFEFALSSPKISQEQIASMLDRAFGGRVDGTLLRFLKVLCRRGRLGFLRSIESAASRLRDEAQGRLRVTVVTATPLSDAEHKTLQATLAKSFQADVSLAAEVDSKILGGLIIRVGDTVYDGSIDGRLNMLRQAATTRTEQAIREKVGSLAS